jgi:copper resistance protein B
MKSAHSALLLSLAIAAMPAVGEEVDHSRMDHSQVDHSATSEATEPARYVHGSDNGIHSYLLFDQLEVRDSDPERALGWNLKGWAGTDLNRIWLRSKGEVISGRAKSASVEVLYGHSVSAWWDLVAGLRHDFRPGKSQTFGAIGIQGLAPQRIDLSATAYVGQGDQVSARLTAEYELLLTNRLVLQPHAELDLHGKTDADRGVGSGISTVHAGLRLRYEVTRRFAPYIGVNWERAFGKTADLAPGGDSELQGVAGVRAWF